MQTQIHPTAIVNDGAELDEGVCVGAYAYIGSKVKILKGTEIMHHATVDGDTILGSNNEIHPYAYIGGKTHDKKYQGGLQRLMIGDNNVFREYVTVHCATAPNLQTKLGDNNLILSYSHVAHECTIGNHLIMSSHSALGGHVMVGNNVNVGWGAGIHQFCRLGDYSMIGAASKVVQDVPPYMISDGNPAATRTINKIGLERANFSKQEIALVRRIYKTFYKDGLNRSQAIDRLSKNESNKHSLFEEFLKFIAASERGLS